MTKPEHGRAALATADVTVASLVDATATLTDGSIRVVDAPAGAGKTGLVTRLIPAHRRAGRTIGVVTQTNEQADDLTRRLVSEQPQLRVVRFVASTHSPDVPGSVIVTSDVATARDSELVIATADKWAYAAEKLSGTTFDVGIVDEAYQMAGGKLLYVADLFQSLELVGDPGQLSPFSPVDTGTWTGLDIDPTRNAVDTIRRYHEVDPVLLPVTRRLPATAADLVQPAFYPALRFAAATGYGDRRLGIGRAAAPSAVDRCVDVALGEGWSHLRLPPGLVTRTDRALAGAIGDLAASLLHRNPTRIADELTGRLSPTIQPERIAIGASHRDQVAAIRRVLHTRGLDGVVVDTANRLQGREFDVVVVWHPLSGQVEASSFHLDVGRLCVLTTRHRHACIVVSRSGIEELLDVSVPVGEGLLGEPMDRTISGWEAHTLVLDHLAPFTVTA